MTQNPQWINERRQRLEIVIRAARVALEMGDRDGAHRMLKNAIDEHPAEQPAQVPTGNQDTNGQDRHD